jgi:hexosaminidase
MKPKTILLLALTMCAFTAGAKEKNTGIPPVNVVPVPVKIAMKPGYFSIGESTPLVLKTRDADMKFCAQYFASQLHEAGGPQLSVRGMTEDMPLPGAIIFEIRKDDSRIHREGYILSVNKNQVRIIAKDGPGIFYAVQTLLQLLPPEITGKSDGVRGRLWNIPCSEITDYPRYPYRGMHLDVSRHFFPKEFIKRYIDLLAMYKMNTFHWHLTDDNGWRIEIKKYPNLTSVGAWRVDREKQPWSSRLPQQPGEKATYGGFYTQDDIREIVQYAADRYINIIPEIEMPAHSVAALAAYPQFSCSGGPYTVLPGSYWPNASLFCAGNDSTFTFIEDVLSEVIDLFPSRYIHIGGDEADKTEWTKCPKCQARIQNENLKDVDELQSYFIRRIGKYIESRSRKMIGWDEILEGGLAPDATVMSWRGIEGGIAAARMGHDAIMTPGSYCYFDYYQADPATEPKAIGGLITLKKVYSYEPTPAELTFEESRHIIGAQGNVWTEYIGTTDQVEYMAVPRMIALAEVDWSPTFTRDWAGFRYRMEDQFKRLDNMGVNYSHGSFRVDLTSHYDRKKKSLMIGMESEQLNVPIRYTLDGNDPTDKSPLYSGPIVINHNCYIKAGHYPDGVLKGSLTQMPVIFHKAVPATITYSQPYSYRYPSAGGDALINGFRGSINYRDGNWQGFLGNDMEVIIDLGKKDTVHSVSTTFLLNGPSWIFLPQYVEFALSGDGKNWHSINEDPTTVAQRQDEPAIHPYSHLFPPTQARYIRVRAKSIGTCPDWHEGKGKPCWMMVDEIVVY